jgi:hypothetical protein
MFWFIWAAWASSSRHIGDSQHEPLCMQVAAGAGMVPSTPALTPLAMPAYVPVSLDGSLIGYIQSGALLGLPEMKNTGNIS